MGLVFIELHEIVIPIFLIAMFSSSILSYDYFNSDIFSSMISCYMVSPFKKAESIADSFVFFFSLMLTNAPLGNRLQPEEVPEIHGKTFKKRGGQCYPVVFYKNRTT
tara:strand:+ start:6108 stop:6428 length:321 start_codon:yes stop_codon:yes gene_type:complete